jgi:predicted ester cyclase
MTADRNRDTIARFDALLGSADLGELDALCTPDMVNHALAPGRPAGLAGTREFLANRGTRFGDAGWSSLTVVAEGDFVVQYGTRGGSWRGGDLLGFDTPAGTYSRDVAFMYRLVDGRIAERWAIRDDLTMLRQLGGLGTA